MYGVENETVISRCCRAGVRALEGACEHGVLEAGAQREPVGHAETCSKAQRKRNTVSGRAALAYACIRRTGTGSHTADTDTSVRDVGIVASHAAAGINVTEVDARAARGTITLDDAGPLLRIVLILIVFRPGRTLIHNGRPVDYSLLSIIRLRAGRDLLRGNSPAA